MSKHSTFESITETATRPLARWSNREVVMFHYFNPNGLCAAKRANDDKISKLVDAGKCASGMILAYGGFDQFYSNQFYSMLDKKHVGHTELAVAISMLTQQIARVNKIIEAHSI